MSALLKTLLEAYPKLDQEIAAYLGGMLDDVDCFESEHDVVENVGIFLADCCHAKQTDIEDLCGRLWKMMDKKVEGPKVLLNAVVFGDNEIDTSATDDVMLITDRQIKSQVDQDKLKKEEAARKKKLARREREEAALAAQKGPEAVKELAVASQGKSKATLSESGDILIENFDLTFGACQLMQDAELKLSKGKRYGLVGRNGAGKSTLLRALHSRSLVLPEGVSLLHVEQEVIGDDTPALESVLDVLEDRKALLAELQDLEAAQKAGQEVSSDRLSAIYAELEDIDADAKPAAAAEILHGLGFTRKMQEAPTKSFSGGWRMRLALAQALLMEPDLLLLDEPTNMLDMRAVLWLEFKLQSWPNTLLTVSHDRSYLNSVCTDIIHLSGRKLIYYKGDYDSFEKTKGERYLQAVRDYEAQKAYRDHIQVFIDRFRYNANRAAQVQSKIKGLEKLPPLVAPEPPEDVNFSFSDKSFDKLDGNFVQIDAVSFRYSAETRWIFKNMDLSADSKSRIAIVGENGAGKSTLLKLLLSRIEPSSGYVKMHRNLRVSYFAQHHIEDFDLNLTPIETLQQRKPGMTSEEYRRVLGRFGCVNDLATRKMMVLSGGQKSRVAFACLAIMKPHLLILDEPTNHLDVETVAALAKALEEFQGGVVLVSHDERLISVACHEVWYCGNQTVKRIEGGLEAYRQTLMQDFEKGGINKHKE